MKNHDLANTVNILDSYANYKLPQRISYAITKNLIKLSSDVECYTKMLSKIIDKYKDYVVKDDNGHDVIGAMGIPVVDEEHTEDYNNDINEFLNLDIDTQLYHISFDEFDYNDSDRYDSLSASDIVRLQGVLCENDDEKGDSVEEAN